jgi:hypothetical protein
MPTIGKEISRRRASRAGGVAEDDLTIFSDWSGGLVCFFMVQSRISFLRIFNL